MKRTLSQLGAAFVAVSSLASFGCGGDILFAELEIPSLCTSIPGQTFPGAPIAVAGTATFPNEFDVGNTLSDFGNLGQVEARALFFDITAKSGVQDFGFVDQVQLKVLPAPNSTLLPVQLVDYKAGAQPPSNNMHWAVNSPDMMGYLKEPPLRFETTFTGTLPTVDWSFDIRLCIFMKARIDYLQALPK